CARGVNIGFDYW
nr:immunoglobulin heavy chain junction region [Macaca mulatta]MOY19028.1 immunoglobulin heavy chain junction region [Macaca mulatta]MOY19701.1 immunoglobulin heavy chain junction region [Macaca mulatta]MOY19852.1 immunoglobulin heavy chain junction region [Macaca mulatta]MOY20153.1 immunoglobulin heavy chain junction region [Macaca mulatta]